MGDREISEDSTLAVPPRVVSRRSADETVLLNLDTEEYFGLERVGTRLWELVESGATFGSALTALGAEFDVDRRALVADLTVLLEDLRAHGLVLIDAA